MNGTWSDNDWVRRSGSIFDMRDVEGSVPLRAGPLSLRFDAGDLRYIKLGEREVIRRIYAAVRDRNWGTVPSEISDLKGEIAEDQFQLSYTRTHRQNEIHFVWKAEIAGKSDGSIRFVFDGEAKSNFLRNRIGFCVLHPMLECAGANARARHADGTEHQVTFPILVAAEQLVSGFHDLVGLAHEIGADRWAEVEFSGDLFETEDQRNWIDASFKTYCTPLRIPYPVEIKAGTRVRQEVRLKIVDGRSELAKRGQSLNSKLQSSVFDLQSDSAVSIIVAPDDRRPLASIGLSIASHGQPLTPREIESLSMLLLWHLRCDVRLARRAWPESLRLASEQAVALGIPLELAVHLPQANGESELLALGARLRELNSDVVRVLLFRDGEETLSLASLRLARPHLAFLNAPIGAGTDADFYQLNQNRPPHADADFIHWSMNPQVHAFDLASLAETPAAIRAQLQSAAAFFPGKPLVVSPVTLKPRFNPVADGPEAALPPGELPPQVDARQLSTFAAGWTLAVLKYLSEAGAESVTLFETTGWLGVMEQAAGSPLPTQFPSKRGQVFPLFYVIGSVNGFCGGEVILTRSSDPLRVESLALFKKGWACLWLANLTDRMQTATVRGFKKVTHQYHIQWDLPQVWMALPAVMLHVTGSPLPTPVQNEIEVFLEPYGLHRLELEL
jgi:hypothetical protein